VEDLLTLARWRDEVPFAGVQITGARILGDVDLENAKLVRPIEIVESRVEGAIYLIRARTDSLILLDGSLINGDFTADGLHAESDLSMTDGAAFKSDVSLIGAKIDRDVDMSRASFEGTLEASGLHASNLFMDSASFKGVDLTGAEITEDISMDGASFDGKLDADSVQVGESLFMRSDGQNQARFNDVDLRNAKVTGQLSMAAASFDGTLNADSLQAGGDLFMLDARYARAVVMFFAHVGGNLDLRGATLDSLDLSGAQIAGDLRLGGSCKPTVWTGEKGRARNGVVGQLGEARSQIQPCSLRTTRRRFDQRWRPRRR
jgi:hypothetical protein